MDGNIHASEVTASAAALYLIQSLVTKYKKDENITRAMDTRAFYIVPRVNPDGAEWALADKPKIIRSSTREYPYLDDPIDGLGWGEDTDGDGRILQMRIEDPNGAWKAHPDEPRLMVRRDPIETGGKYYRILPEGLLKNYDGVTIKVLQPKQGLDLNRNFPAGWRTESDQNGAGPYPTSEPEARNLVDFIAKHPNITGTISFHTMSGVLLRPYDDRPDDQFPNRGPVDVSKDRREGNARSRVIRTSLSFMISNIIPSRSSRAASIHGRMSTWVFFHGQLNFGVR